jgi:hypothetical protein
MPAPPAKKENQKTKFLGLTVDGRVRMLRSFARRREKYTLRSAEERLLCAYATLFSPTKVHGVCKFNAYWFFTFFWLTKGSRNKN